MADPVLELIPGSKTAMDLYELAKKLGWVDQLKAFWKKKKRIIVLGSTGAGKTQFIDSMQQLLPQLILNTDRTAFPLSRVLNIAGDLFEITDTPGQENHQARRLTAIKDAMAHADGVINVVSFGYHEGDVSADAALTKQNMPRKEFLRSQRDTEIRAAAEWTGLLSAGVRNPWLITLVTKADLWWEQREEVKAHYESGPYHQSLGQALEMNPTVCLYSSIRHRFFGSAPVSGQFDDGDRLHLRTSFFRVLFEAIGKTAKPH